jgi:hypothetical protein
MLPGLSILDFPLLRFDLISEDWSKGQESSRRFIYVQLLVQNYIIIQLFMVHATHGWKAYQVHFHNQQKARHFDFSLKSYDY